jgi:hypothetical protein
MPGKGASFTPTWGPRVESALKILACEFYFLHVLSYRPQHMGIMSGFLALENLRQRVYQRPNRKVTAASVFSLSVAEGDSDPIHDLCLDPAILKVCAFRPRIALSRSSPCVPALKSTVGIDYATSGPPAGRLNARWLTIHKSSISGRPGSFQTARLTVLEDRWSPFGCYQ